VADADDLKARVSKILAEEVGPALQMDGGAIEVLDVSDGVVRVRLGGVCAGCPSTVMAVLMGLEQELRQRVPEVVYLEAVPGEEPRPGGSGASEEPRP
jgi:Fe-S cluster biogenesis protein NfuA